MTAQFNELNTAHKIGILARNVLYENLCRTEDRLQQHNTPGVLPYDQIESVTLVDA